MKKLFSVFILLSLSLFASAQIYDPVSWKFNAENIADKEATIVITATIEPGWHVYSQFIEEGGPIPTSFTFEGSGFTKVGGVVECPKAISAFDPNFNMQIAWHKDEVKFSQKIKLTQPKTTVKGMLEFMVCNDTHCLPPEEVPFTVQVDASKAAALAQDADKPETVVSQNEIVSTNLVTLPESAQVGVEDKDDSIAVVGVNDSTFTNDSGSNGVSNDVNSSSSGEQSLWGIFIAGLIGGFAAFLMPCIYPMVPLTTSFFTKQGGSRSKGLRMALIYVLSIIVIYVDLGILITLVFVASALNDLSSSALL